MKKGDLCAAPLSGHRYSEAHEHPVVAPQVLHSLCAVSHQSEVLAFAAGFALVALRLGLGPLLGGGGLRLLPLQRFELPGRRQLLLRLGLERGRGVGDRGDVEAPPAVARATASPADGAEPPPDDTTESLSVRERVRPFET